MGIFTFFICTVAIVTQTENEGKSKIFELSPKQGEGEVRVNFSMGTSVPGIAVK